MLLKLEEQIKTDVQTQSNPNVCNLKFTVRIFCAQEITVSVISDCIHSHTTYFHSSIFLNTSINKFWEFNVYLSRKRLIRIHCQKEKDRDRGRVNSYNYAWILEKLLSYTYWLRPWQDYNSQCTLNVVGPLVHPWLITRHNTLLGLILHFLFKLAEFFPGWVGCKEKN